jgi:hypothetical protein
MDRSSPAAQGSPTFRKLESRPGLDAMKWAFPMGAARTAKHHFTESWGQTCLGYLAPGSGGQPAHGARARDRCTKPVCMGRWPRIMDAGFFWAYFTPWRPAVTIYGQGILNDPTAMLGAIRSGLGCSGEQRETPERLPKPLVCTKIATLPFLPLRGRWHTVWQSWSVEGESWPRRRVATAISSIYRHPATNGSS